MMSFFPRLENPKRWAVAFIALMTAAQLLFLTWGCDWDLCGDEAEFWAWSRKLDWSYYCRGPLIALVIRLGTMLAGDASLALTGSQMLAVRLPASILGALTAWGLFRLTSETCRSERAGLIAVLLLPTVPLFRIGALLMTCDTPLVCCWTWAAVWAYRGFQRDDVRAWSVAGVLAGLGVMAKYTMLAFPASIGLFLLARREHHRHLLRPGFWVMSLGCALGMAPIVVWNNSHDWVAAEQLADRVGLATNNTWGGLGFLLLFLGSEVLVLGVWWLAGALAIGRTLDQIVRALKKPLNHDAELLSGRLFLISLWVVIWSACVTVALLGQNEANWIAPAHVAVIGLVGIWLDQGILGGRTARVRLAAAAWVFGLISLSLLQHTEWFYPWAARFVPAATANRPAPLRAFDPTCRMRGYRELVPEVEARLAALRAEGLDPFVLAPTYTLASTLSFSLPGQPEVYCLSWSPGFAARATNQHDLWHPNPRHDIETFRNRPAVVVENAEIPMSYAGGLVKLGIFGKSEPTSRLDVRRQGLVVASWNLTLCRAYRGPIDVEHTREVLKKFASSSYYESRGGTPRGFALGLYRDLLERAASPVEEDAWLRLIAIHPRDTVVAQMVMSKEYQALRTARLREANPRRVATKPARDTSQQ